MDMSNFYDKYIHSYFAPPPVISAISAKVTNSIGHFLNGELSTPIDVPSGGQSDVHSESQSEEQAEEESHQKNHRMQFFNA